MRRRNPSDEAQEKCAAPDADAETDARYPRCGRGATEAAVLRRLRGRDRRRHDNAEAKRRRKKLPLLVANRAQDAMGQDQNEVTLLDDAGAHPLPRMDKLALARRLVAEIAARLPK